MKAVARLAMLFALTSGLMFGQEITLPFNNQNLVNLNPSFAGSNGLLRNQTTFYDQWPKTSSRYLTFNNSFDAYIKPLRAGLALTYQHSDQSSGFLKSDFISLAYAQHLSFMNNEAEDHTFFPGYVCTKKA